MIAHLDYEFRSGVDITDVGSHRTSIDPRFELLMAAVSREGDPHVYLWINPLFHDAGVPHENEAAERILAEAAIVYAHNAPNEQANTWGALQQEKACPFKTEPPITIWRCTAAEARKAGLPYSLDKLCAALGLVDGKDRAGKALIKFFSAPKDDGTFNEPRDYPEKWAAFCNYCRQDVRAEIQCGEKLKPFQLTGAALATFQFDLRMNQRGIPINLAAARNAQRIIDEVQAGVRDEFRALTGLNVTQRDKVKEWLAVNCGLEMPNMQSDTVEEAIESSTGLAKRVLTMYQSVSYAAVKKVRTMLDCACPDGRVRGGHMYYGAGTGRWCLTGDHEVLTPQGWCRIDGWSGGSIACWNKSEEVSFQDASRVCFPFKGTLYLQQSQRINQLATGDHRTPGWTAKTNKFEVRLAKDLTSGFQVPYTGFRAKPAQIHPDELRLLVATQADGYYGPDGSVRFHFKKQRKIERLGELLNRLNLPFSSANNADGSTSMVIVARHVPLFLHLFREKTFGNWLLDADAAVFFEELELWDGYRAGPNSIQYSTTNGVNADWIQALAHTSGFATSRTKKTHPDKNWADCHVLSIWLTPSNRGSLPARPVEQPFEGSVYCAETPTGFFLVRREGVVWVTGNSGKLLQPQNFKKTPPELRPYSGKIYEHLCRSTNAEVIDELFCSPLEGIASSIRHFIHDPKTAMLDGDYSGVEARIIAWLAGQEDVLQEWRDYDAGTGLGPYKHMAAVIYGIGAEAVTKDQREIGKRIVLGCFGPDTLVVTSRGLKAITHITCEDWLWDGVDWTQSDGVIYRGCEDTIQLEGVTVTEDHSVLSGKTWHEAGYLAHDGGMTSRALATALGSLLSSGSGSASAAEFSFTEFNALVDRALTTSTLPVSTTGLQRDAIAALRSKLIIRGNGIGVTQTSSRTGLCEIVFSTAFLAALPDATVRRINNFIITAVEEYLSIRLGGKTGESFSDTLSRLLTTTKLQEILTGKTSIGDMNPATSGSPQSEKTSTTEGRLRRSKNGSKSLNGKSHVYDVANAGPRSRFTIWTDNGPLIVHNCGFQMGPDKFQESCRVQYGLDLPMELCVKGVKAFRRKCDRIRDYWWSLNNSAISAIRNPGATFGAFTVRRIAGMSFLLFRLRSGRALSYPHPEVNMVKWVPPKDAKVELDEFGDPIEPEVKWREEITYWGQIPGSQQWGRIKLYGGKLAENETQATAADFMAHGAITAEARGMPPFMLVHDQGLALKNGHTEAEFERALGDLPAWAKGFPMKVEVGTTPYFTKE